MLFPVIPSFPGESVATFVILHIAGGQVCMSILLFTILFSPRITRHAVFVNFCITWILFSLSYLLLFYAGDIHNPRPKFLLCIVQAAMVYGAAPTAGLSGLILILHIYVTLRRTILGLPPLRSQRFIRCAMLLLPYILYMIICAISAVIGTKNPNTLSRNAYYCYIDFPLFARLSPLLSAVAMIGVMLTEGMILFTLRRHWKTFLRIAGDVPLTVHFMIRLFLYTLFTVVALLLCVAFLLIKAKDSVADLITASLPLAVFLILGTQSHLFRPRRLRNKGLRSFHMNRTDTEIPSAKDSCIAETLEDQRPERSSVLLITTPTSS